MKKKKLLSNKNCGRDISSLSGNRNTVSSHYDMVMTSELNKIDYLLKMSVYLEKLTVFVHGKLV